MPYVNDVISNISSPFTQLGASKERKHAATSFPEASEEKGLMKERATRNLPLGINYCW